MTRRTRATAAAGLGAVLSIGLSGCAVLTETPATATVEAPETAAVAPAVPAERVTIEIPKPRSAAPTLKTTGTAWPTILASLADYGQWVLANPNPALVENVATPGCATANHLSRQVTGMLGSRTYLKPNPPVFTTVNGPVPADGATDALLGDTVTLDVTASRPSGPVISRTGQQVSTFAPLPQTRLQVTLRRDADNKWRFCTITTMGTPATGSPVALL